MAYLTNHHLLSFGGTLPGEETWTMGLRLAGINSGGSAAEEALLADYAATLSARWSVAEMTSSGAKLRWAKLNEIGTDGKYVNPITNLIEFEAPGIAGGSGGGSALPNQISLVVSLTTMFSRGLAHAGRLFFPIPAVTASPTDGLISVAAQTSLLASAKLFLDEINAVGEGTVIVASKERTGAQHVVTGVRVGRVLDTMRSRRSSLPEGYLKAELDPSTFAGDGGPF